MVEEDGEQRQARVLDQYLGIAEPLGFETLFKTKISNKKYIPFLVQQPLFYYPVYNKGQNARQNKFTL